MNILNNLQKINKGQEFKHRINKYLKDFEGFQTQILPFIRTVHGKNVLYSYFSLIKEKFPWYAEEIKVKKCVL